MPHRGNGAILWRLGKDGDFRLEGGTGDDWFSHQHDPEYEAGGTITIFDNGNTRRATDNTVQSRGQAWVPDVERKTAKLVFNANLGIHSVAVGTAQLLDNGNYLFDCGFLFNGTAVWFEMNPQAIPVYSIRSASPEYRSRESPGDRIGRYNRTWRGAHTGASPDVRNPHIFHAITD